MTRSARLPRECPTCGTPTVLRELYHDGPLVDWCPPCMGVATQPPVQRITTRPEDLREDVRRSWSERLGDGIGASSLLWLALVLWVLAGLVGAS